MTSVATLLRLPESSSSFGKSDSSSSNKIPRLDSDADISKGRSASTQGHPANQGTAIVSIKIISDDEDMGATRRTRIDFKQTVLQHMRRFLSLDDTYWKFSYEGIFNACRGTVSEGHGKDIHDQLCVAFTRYAREIALQLREIEKKPNVDSIAWLYTFQEACLAYLDKMRTLQSLYSCLDQLYVLVVKSVDSIEQVAIKVFIDSVLSDVVVALKLREGINDWALWEREKGSVHKDREMVTTVISHLSLLGQYSIFEEDYVKSTSKHYATFAEKRSDIEPRGYFLYMRQQIEQEFKRTVHVFQPSSWNAVRTAAEHSLLSLRKDTLATGTIGPFIQSNDFELLAELYQLYDRAGAFEILRGALRVFVFDSVKLIITDDEKTHQEQMVQRLLTFNATCHQALKQGFSDIDPSSTNTTPNSKFRQAVYDGFRTGFQQRKNKPAEMIAKYLDKVMRKGQQGSSDAAFHKLLDDALALYRFTDDKDVFRTFYHRQFAKRLLSGRSASNDIELEMLKKLKTEYDAEFEVGEQMFTDLALSKDLVDKWHEAPTTNIFGQKLHVFVLQHSVWPFSAEKSSILLPIQMQSQLDSYGTHYKHMHKNRKLTWNHSLGSAELQGNFKHGKKDLTMSLHQATVLLLFNMEEQLTYDTIKGHVRLEPNELVPLLQSLACGKKRILKKSSPGKEVNSDDNFQVNNDFRDEKVKVHINSIQAKVTEEESQRTQGEIESDRKHIVQAAIVRIMKAKKEMLGRELEMAVIDAVKMHFVPSVDLIKRQIDWCIGDEYLTRDETDKRKFYYQA